MSLVKACYIIHLVSLLRENLIYIYMFYARFPVVKYSTVWMQPLLAWQLALRCLKIYLGVLVLVGHFYFIFLLFLFFVWISKIFIYFIPVYGHEGSIYLTLCLYYTGIVRGIDALRGLFYVITPVPPNILEKVDLFLQGFIQIPTCLLQVTDFNSSLQFWRFLSLKWFLFNFLWKHL